MPFKTTVTPVLSSSTGYVMDVPDQVSNLLRFFIMNPGGTSSLWENDLISFQTLAAKYENDRSELCSNATKALNKVLNRMFPDFRFNINLSARDLDSSKKNLDPRYIISFNIQMSSSTIASQSALRSGTITVNKNTNEIDIKFNRDFDPL